MKQLSPYLLPSTAGAAILLLLTLAAPARPQAPAPPHDHQHGSSATRTTPAPPSAAKPGTSGKGMPMGMDGGAASDCAAMMQMHQQEVVAQTADDARLADLTAKMNQAASGDQKTEAMAAVINELVAQHTRALARTQEMQSQMMTHMMAHLQHGGAAEAMQCPMMKMMAGEHTAPGASGPGSSAGEHTQHP